MHNSVPTLMMVSLLHGKRQADEETGWYDGQASTSAANKCSQNMLEEETEKDGESSFVGRIALEGKLGLELEKQILH
ncbi:hypothetical protein V6N13_098083 [Hibiscus sabdariffa]